ncbi:DUF3006 domain-containing protein [Halorussus amylolyticus]|uniref:DUF3006 domain-containing protein n=1 Tax=Halorussus amylolyticus TaxID=1126242 RepID=UPI00104C2532|nr:DUF3006 domain-containing protein [Halorussus amylolyticus]
MIPDGRYTAVVDRFEGERAVLLVEDGEETVGEMAVREGRLPDDARHQDAILRVTVQNGNLVGASYDPDESERRRSEAQSRFDRLARRPDDDSEE